VNVERDDYGRIVALTKPHFMALMGQRLPAQRSSGNPGDSDLHESLARITPEDIALLLHEPDWRPRITAAYFCGFKRWDDFQLDIGRLLLSNELCFVPSGYAFALARFGTHASANYLRGYLNQYLKDPDNWYDWIGAPFAALQWLDLELGTSHCEDYEAILRRHIVRVMDANWTQRERNYAGLWRDAYFRHVHEMEASGQQPLSQIEFAAIKDPEPPAHEKTPAQVTDDFLRGARKAMWQLMEWCQVNGY
jgi:hypothetical protein